MKPWVTILLLLLFLPATAGRGQTNAAAANRAAAPQFESLDDWIQENIDPDVLNVLKQMDQQRTEKLFSELQQAMNGTNIYQLGTLRETATQLVPILQKFEETAPYGNWLATHLDYLNTAEELQREMRAAAPRAEVTVLPAAPTLKLERQVWTRELDRRPWPPLAQTYVPRLKQVFISEKLPPELVWVAEVESSFHPGARSPAGAAGMFQLMPQTARDAKLSLWPWDERYQPEKSARAAAIYLRQLHAHYQDWELALAAYNAGVGRVDKLLKRQNARSFEAIASRLPAETQMYVPKIEATIRKREGRELADLKMPKT